MRDGDVLCRCYTPETWTVAERGLDGPGLKVGTGSAAGLGISAGGRMEWMEHTYTEDADEEDCVEEPCCISKAVQAVEEARER